LSVTTFSIAAAFATGSSLIGIWAAMPPIAWAPRRWQVRIKRREYAVRNGVAIVSCSRSGKWTRSTSWYCFRKLNR
jgi:hypothetical protein